MSSSAGGSSAAKVRQLILFLILLVAIAGLVYEFAVAKPGFDSASKTVQDLAMKAGSKDVDYITDETVHEELGTTPSEVKDVDETHKLEIYKYRRGIPIRFYSLAVGYRKMNEKWALQTSWENKIPENSEWIKPMNVTNEGVNKPEGGSGRSAPGGGGGGGGGAPASEGTIVVPGAGMKPPSDGAPAGGDDKAGDDKAGDDKGGDDKSGDDKAGDDKAGDDKAGDDAKAGDDKSGDAGDAKAGDDAQSGDDAKSGDDKSGDAGSSDDTKGGDDTGSGDSGSGDDASGDGQ